MLSLCWTDVRPMSDLYLAAQRILQACQKRGKTQVSRAKMPPKVNLRAIEVASGHKCAQNERRGTFGHKMQTTYSFLSTPWNLNSLFTRDSTPRFFFASSSPHLRKSWVSVRKMVFLISKASRYNTPAGCVLSRVSMRLVVSNYLRYTHVATQKR